MISDYNFDTNIKNFGYNRLQNEENHLRKDNMILSQSNNLLKEENKKLENKIIIEGNNNDTNGKNLKDKLRRNINNNALMVYQILNCIKDIDLLNSSIEKMNKYYNGIKLNKLIFDNNWMKYQKEETEIRKNEYKNKYNNLNTLYNFGLQKNNTNKKIISCYQNIIDALNYRNNYIQNEQEANIKIDFLLNQKQNLIENNIKLINIINQIKSKKGNKQNMKLNKENEHLKILKEKNIKLKDALHKYDNIIKNLNLSIKNKSNNSKSENGIDQKLFEANKYNDKIKNGIENTINKYKNEISQKNLLINKLTNKYISLKKNDLSSVDKIII